MDSVLVPVDGSEQSKEALTFVLEQFPDATIHILHIVQVTSFPEGKQKTPADLAEEEGEAILDDAMERVNDHSGPVTTALRHGQATAEILAYAEDKPVDMIVMGSRGKQGIKRLLLGSVAETVVRRAAVPVTVIR